SLAAGVPVVDRLVIHAADGDIHGHAHTIFAVSDKVYFNEKHPSGAFTIRVFEQDYETGHGAVLNFTVFERVTNVEEAALQRTLTSGGDRTFVPLQVNSSTFTSPFLEMAELKPDGTRADPYDIGTGSDSYVLFESAFGAFPASIRSFRLSLTKQIFD